MATLQAVDYQDPEAPARFAASLKETGFGVLRNHPIEQTRVSAIYAHWEAFFKHGTPLDYSFDPERYDGFFPMNRAETAKGHHVRDIKEYYHYYPWGRCPASLRDEIAAYYDDTIALAAELLGWVEANTPDAITGALSEPLSSMIAGSEQTLLRILHYPPLPQAIEPGAIRAGAHEDINLLTVLPAANEPGLQVLGRDGDWLDVPCDFGNLIINIGDMLQEATGHYYPSTTHRVINPEGADASRSRISLPMFLHPRPDVVLSTRYTAGSYLVERLEELRKSDKTG